MSYFRLIEHFKQDTDFSDLNVKGLLKPTIETYKQISNIITSL